jgi:hypothetical protein
MAYQIGRMASTQLSFTHCVTELVTHPELGQFGSYEEAKKFADQIGDTFLPWPIL